MSKKYYLIKLTSIGDVNNRTVISVDNTIVIDDYSNELGQYRKILINDESIEDQILEVGKEYQFDIDTNIAYHIRGKFSGVLTRILVKN